MQFRIYAAALLVLLLAFPACMPRPTTPPATQPDPLPPAATYTATPSATPDTPAPRTQDAIPTQTPTPTVEPALPAPGYTLTATLSYATHHLAVEEQIRYINASPDALAELLLMVEPAYYPGVFSLNSLTLGDGTPLDQLRWDGGQLHVSLPAALAPRAMVSLHLGYELQLPSPQPSPDTRPVVFGYTDRQTNLVDWYPFIPPYIPGQGWLAHKPGFYGEHLVFDSADFDVRIRILDPSPALVIAASALPEADGEWQRYTLLAARNFVWSVSPQYSVVSETVGAVTVLGYAFPFNPQAGAAAVKTTAQALELYSQLFGPYPRQVLSVVEADFLDGMEYDGLYFLSDGFYNLYPSQYLDYLIAIAAHETAHQWWYALVANDQAQEPWLDEALCTYSEHLFYERYLPDRLRDWQYYRLDINHPQGWVDSSIYNNPGGFVTYRSAVYLNGALFLDDLRQTIGDQAFFAFLKDYAAQKAHHIATHQDFFSILRQHTSADLNPLISKYFEHP